MSKNFRSSAKTFAKNVSIHLRRVFQRRETCREAWADVAQDAHRLKRALLARIESESRQEATRLLEQGRLEYNIRDYESAEDYFKRAIQADRGYGLAYTFLGYALYKQGRMDDAVRFWQKAIKVEPDSEAASRARKKIQYIEKSKHGTVSRLEKNIRESKR